MEYFGKMVELQGLLFIYMAVGFAMRKAQVVSGDTVQEFINFLVKVSLPCMIFNSFNLVMDRATLLQGGYILLLSAAISMLTIPLGKLLYKNVPAAEKSVMQYGTLVSNAGFAGLPLVSAAFGPQAMFYAAIYLIPTRILMWSAGISLFTQRKGRGAVKEVLLNPGIVAVLLGLLRMLLELQIPAMVNSALVNIGNIASPLSIIIVGAILADVDIRTVVEKNVLYLSLVRLILLPLAVLLCLTLLGADFFTGCHLCYPCGYACGGQHSAAGKKLWGKPPICFKMCICFHNLIACYRAYAYLAAVACLRNRACR